MREEGECGVRPLFCWPGVFLLLFFVFFFLSFMCFFVFCGVFFTFIFIHFVVLVGYVVFLSSVLLSLFGGGGGTL